MNTVSLRTLGDWQKQMAIPLQDILRVSMDVVGKTGAGACMQCLILMAQSARAMTPKSKSKRPVEIDVGLHGAKYVNVFHKGKQSRLYEFNFLRGGKMEGTWDQARIIKNKGLAARSWMWGLRGMKGALIGRPIPGVAKTLTILGEKACGYILQNSLSYLLKIMPAGWQAAVATKAGNKIMKQAAMKIERQWKSEMSHARRGGMGIGLSLARHFAGAA